MHVGIVYISYMYRYLLTYILTYIHTYMHACMHVYIHTYIHTAIHACMTHIRTFTFTLHYMHYMHYMHYIHFVHYIHCIHCIHYIHYIHTLHIYMLYMCIHVHTCAYMCIQIHTCVCVTFLVGEYGMASRSRRPPQWIVASYVFDSVGGAVGVLPLQRPTKKSTYHSTSENHRYTRYTNKLEWYIPGIKFYLANLHFVYHWYHWIISNFASEKITGSWILHNG